jgi:hypothetical protein
MSVGVERLIVAAAEIGRRAWLHADLAARTGVTPYSRKPEPPFDGPAWRAYCGGQDLALIDALAALGVDVTGGAT